MDEFKDLEEEISKLEGGLGEEDFLSRLRTPAQGDYWKKRMEDEKELWNKTVESKEQENKRLEKKLQNTEEELRILQKKLSEIELSLQKDALEWEDRVRNKDMELVLERERATWSARVKEIEKENEGLKAKVEELKTFADEASKNAELRVSETKSAHKAEMEQLLREQEEVLSTLEAMEKCSEEMKSAASSWEDEIAALKKKMEELEARKSRLETVIVMKEERLSRALERHNKLIVRTAEHLSGGVRKFSGILLGIFDFCGARLRRSFSFSSTALKRQMVVAGAVVGEMMESVARSRDLINSAEAGKEEIAAARVVSRLDEDADVFGIPWDARIALTPGLLKMLKNLRPDVRRAAARYSATPAGEIEIRVTLNKGASLSESVSLALEFYSNASDADFIVRDADGAQELVFVFPCAVAKNG
jgi:hypothetical protein